MEDKIDQKLIKKGGQDGKASWHRFLMDFGGFLEASWEGKWSQDRSKKASKKRWKNGKHQDGQKVATSRNKASRSEGSRALGRYPPNSGANPTPTRLKSTTAPPCLPKSCLVLPWSLSCLVLPYLALSCPVLSCLGSIFLPNLASKIHQNPEKIDVGRPFHPVIDFCSILDRFLLPTWRP